MFGCRLGMALVDSPAEAENSLNRLWQRRLSLEEPQQKIHHHRVVGHGLLDPLIVAHILTTTSFQGEKKKNENLVGGDVLCVFVLDDGEREQRTGRLMMKTEGDLLVPFFFFQAFFFILF